MTHPVAFCHQVLDVLGVGAHRQRHPLDDVQAVAVQPDALGRVVGQQPHGPDSEIDEDLRTSAVVPGVGGQAQLEVGIHGVVTGVLQLVGLQLVHQADPAALVTAHIKDDAASFAGHHRHRGVQLRPAVAAAGTEYIAGKAFGVHPDQDVLAVAVRPGDLAANQRHVLDILVDARVTDGAELAVPGRDAGLGDPGDVLLVLAAPLDEVGDGDEREVVFVGEDPQLVGLGHGAFVFLADDLANRTGRLQAGQPGQIDGGLGVAGAAQHAAVLGAQRDDVTGLAEVVDDGRRVSERTHRSGPVGSRNPCADTLFRIDGHRICGTVLVLVDRVHRQ